MTKNEIALALAFAGGLSGRKARAYRMYAVTSLYF